eukprot:9491029-Pyramimonas_sp.AAC.1
MQYDLIEYFVEVVKLAVPTNDGTPRIIKRREDIPKVKLVLEAMEQSKLFTASQAPAAPEKKPT